MGVKALLSDKEEGRKWLQLCAQALKLRANRRHAKKLGWIFTSKPNFDSCGRIDALPALPTDFSSMEANRSSARV